MPKTEMSTADRRVHDLHHQGFAASRIAQMTGRSESDVHAVIVGGWYSDKMGAKAAKQAARTR